MIALLSGSPTTRYRRQTRGQVCMVRVITWHAEGGLRALVSRLAFTRVLAKPRRPRSSAWRNLHPWRQVTSRWQTSAHFRVLRLVILLWITGSFRVLSKRWVMLAWFVIHWQLQLHLVNWQWKYRRGLHCRHLVQPFAATEEFENSIEMDTDVD